LVAASFSQPSTFRAGASGVRRRLGPQGGCRFQWIVLPRPERSPQPITDGATRQAWDPAPVWHLAGLKRMKANKSGLPSDWLLPSLAEDQLL
jgi:hypothetical protein